MSIFTRSDWDRLATLYEGVKDLRPGVPVSYEPYAGYKPETREAPNGDTKVCPVCQGGSHPGSGDMGRAPCYACHESGRVPNTDAGPAGKRYLHVAEKYLAQHPGLDWPREYLARAYYEICRVADALHVPDAYYPRPEDTTLRVLEYPSAGHMFADAYTDYPCKHCGVKLGALKGDTSGICPALAPGAGTAEHTDADLFTIVCWRETPEDLERDYWPSDAGPGEPSPRDFAEALSPGLHIGQIGELVGLGPATPHRVPARPYVQRSIVAFAMPRLDALLPTIVPLPDNGAIPKPWRNQTVREWIEAWKKRGRVYT